MHQIIKLLIQYLGIRFRLGSSCDAASDAFRPSHPVRLTNYYRVFQPLILSLLLFTLAIYAGISRKFDRTNAYSLSALSSLAGIFLFITATRRVLWMEVGTRIRIRRLLGEETHEQSKVKQWRFIENRFRYFYGKTIYISFSDGLGVELHVPSSKIQSLAELMHWICPTQSA